MPFGVSVRFFILWELLAKNRTAIIIFENCVVIEFSLLNLQKLS